MIEGAGAADTGSLPQPQSPSHNFPINLLSFDILTHDKAQNDLETARFDNIDSTVIISKVSKAVQNWKFL